MQHPDQRLHLLSPTPHCRVKSPPGGGERHCMTQPRDLPIMHRPLEGALPRVLHSCSGAQQSPWRAVFWAGPCWPGQNYGCSPPALRHCLSSGFLCLVQPPVQTSRPCPAVQPQLVMSCLLFSPHPLHQREAPCLHRPHRLLSLSHGRCLHEAGQTGGWPKGQVTL